MPSREESFRIGCGRYLQKEGVLRECGSEVLALGKHALVIGDDITLPLVRNSLEESFRSASVEATFLTHNGSCNEEDALSIAKVLEPSRQNVIIGAGGGTLMDFAKLVAVFSKSPIINIPTSSATCAAYAPLSVCYTRSGRSVGTRHHKTEVNARGICKFFVT